MTIQQNCQGLSRRDCLQVGLGGLLGVGFADALRAKLVGHLGMVQVEALMGFRQGPQEGIGLRGEILVLAEMQHHAGGLLFADQPRMGRRKGGGHFAQSLDGIGVGQLVVAISPSIRS